MYIPGGKRQIFPMFDRFTISKSEKWLLENVKKRAHEFNWYCIADPANDSVFAVLFAAVHPETRDVFIVDLIYEKDRNKTSAAVMWESVQEKIAHWNADKDAWGFFYDDHESWFEIESNRVPGAPNWLGAGKYSQSKGTGISSVKDCLLEHKFWVNVGLTDLFTEFENYCTDLAGKIPKGRDHTIDTVRYLLIVSNWDTVEQSEDQVPAYLKNDPWLAYAIRTEEQIQSEEMMDDWTHDMFNDFAEVPIYV